MKRCLLHICQEEKYKSAEIYIYGQSLSVICLYMYIIIHSVNTVWSIYYVLAATAAAKSLQSCPALCDPIDGSPPGSPVPGILQARTLEWAAISFSNAWKWKVKVKSLSRVRLLATPVDCSLPGSSVNGIFQARVLEWGAIAISLQDLIINLFLLQTHILVLFGLAMLWA